MVNIFSKRPPHCPNAGIKVALTYQSAEEQKEISSRYQALMAAHPFNTKLVCHEGWIDLSFALKGYAEKFCINLAKRQSFVVLDPESLKVMAYANGKDGKFYLPNHEVFGQSKHHLGPSQISYQDFSIPPLADSKPEPRIQL